MFSKKRSWVIVLSALALILCRESYAFSTLLFSLFLVVRKSKTGVIVLLLSLISLYFNFFLRKELLGVGHDYAGELVGPLLKTPFSFILQAIKVFDYIGFLKFTYPLLLLLLFIYERKNKALRKGLLVSLLLVIPHMAIHFLTNKIHFHYSGVILAPFLVIALILGNISKLRPWKKTIVLLAFIASGMSMHTRFINYYLLEKSKRCHFEDERKINEREVLKKVGSLSKDLVYFSSKRLSLKLLAPGRLIYINPYYENVNSYYDILAIEINYKGDYDSYKKEKNRTCF